MLHLVNEVVEALLEDRLKDGVVPDEEQLRSVAVMQHLTQGVVLAVDRLCG